ncbi:MAG: ABC-three component system protein [bacterium]
MSTGERGQYSAASSSLGYFYQSRYALLEALRRLPEGDRICIGIETLDDVVFQTDGSAVEVLQTKHHIKAHASLADASPDLWKTLRIWIEGQSDGSIPQDAQFFLITTALSSDGTAAAYLRPGDRNEAKALERLAATASTSTSVTNASAYQAFTSLKDEGRALLLKSIAVLDGSPSIGQLDDQLRQAVFYAVERRFLNSYLQRLEAWWYGRVVKHLLDDSASPILGEELEAEASRIRGQFKDDSLPVDDDIMRATVNASGYLGRAFVEQLKLIGVNENRVVHAIRNYYRAFEQRSRWMREDLLYVGELDRYEERLIEEWDLMFQQMRDELGGDAAAELKARAAQNLYKWVETGTHHVIRPAVTEPAIARGTFQMLADDLRVGWHLEFRERLRAILSGTEASR